MKKIGNRPITEADTDFSKMSTLDYWIVVGLHLFINQILFWKCWWKKNQKWPQCLDWCKNALKSWYENYGYSYSVAYAYLIV